MLFIRTNTTKNDRRAQVLLHPCGCWEPWVGHCHTGLQSAGNPSIESATPFLSSKLLQDFLVRRQLCALFLLSNRRDMNSKTSFRTVVQPPSGSCLASQWEQAGCVYPASKGYVQLSTAWRPRCTCGPWRLLGVTRVWITNSSTCNSPPPRALHCYITAQAEIHCLLFRKIVPCQFHSSDGKKPSSFKTKCILCLFYSRLLWYSGIRIVTHFKYFVSLCR